MCKLVKRKISLICQCNFLSNGIFSILGNGEHIENAIEESSSLTPHSMMRRYDNEDDVYIQFCRGGVEKLSLIHFFMLLPSKPRVIVIVNDSHKPTLKLLRAMGVLFIFSLSDSLSDFEKILQCSTNDNYISPDLFATIHPVQSSTARAMNRDFFNGIKYLTLSETNIILYLLNGIPPWLVARKLCISVKTVSSHKINALRKMNLSGINEFFIP